MLPTRKVRTTWTDPFDLMHRDFDRMLGRWFGDSESQGAVAASYPVDIHEDQDHIYVEAEMPGFKRDEINVTLENGVLSITGERKADQREGTRHLQERRFTRVSRSFTLPNSVDETQVDAKLEEGVLKLTLTKRDEVKPRRIEVK